MFGNFDSFRRGFDLFSSRNVNMGGGGQDIKPPHAARDAKKKAPKPRTLRLESLENRELLSASAAELSTISASACALESSVCPMQNDDAAIAPLQLAASMEQEMKMKITGFQKTSDSIVVHWEGPNGVQYPDNTTGYTVIWYTQNGNRKEEIGRSDRKSDQNEFIFQYEITNLKPGTTYVIEVEHRFRAFNNTGFLEYATYTPDITVTTDTSQLLPPTGLSTKSEDCQQLTVSWKSVENAESYTVKYRLSGKGSWTTLSGITQTTKTIKGLEANTEYDIRVIAKGDGTHYTDSEPATTFGKTIDATKLAPPVISVSSPSANSITITWDKVDGAEEYYYEYAPEGGKTEYATQKGRSFTRKNLSSGKTYTFKVKAIGDGGDRYYDSDYSTRSFTVLTSPTVTKQNSDKHSISVNWKSVANASEYEVKWSPANKDGDSSDVVKDASYTITNLKAGKTYSFTVVAKGDGVRYLDSKESVKKSVKTSDRELLSTPTITTKSGANTITVEWNYDANASGYEVSWSPANKLGVSSAKPNGANFTIAELEPGTEYKVTVLAKGDGDDYGDYKENTASTDVSTVALPKLNSPTNVKTSATATTVSVSWDPVAGANGYILWYKSNAKSKATATFYQRVDVGKNTSCSIPGLSELTTYDVLICAKGDQNNSADSDFYKTSVTTLAPGVLTWPDGSKLTATEVKPNKITVAWPDVAKASDYVVEYRRYVASSKKWTNWSSFTAGSGEKTSASITTNAKTKYQIRVKAIGKGDYKDSNYLASLKVTTPEKQLKAPGYLKKTGVTANSISVKWGKVANAEGYVVFLYRVSDGKLVSKTDADTNSCTIKKGVAANTTYEIKVCAMADGFNPSPVKDSPVLENVTTPKAQLKAPGYLKKTGVTANSISVEWGKVANATEYVVLLFREGKQVSTTVTSTNSCTITKNVVPNTKYEIKVRAKDGSSTSPISPGLPVTTPKAQLKAPGKPSKTGVTANSISVTWGKVANATKYVVLLFRDGKQVSTSETSTNSCTITNKVAAGTTYEIKVRAKNGSTTSPFSDPLTVTTPKAQLKAPGYLKKTGVTANSISVTWGKVANATTYVVLLFRDGKQVSTTETSTNSCTITKNVVPNTKYEIKVRAKDGPSTSPISPGLPVTTPKAQLKAPGKPSKTGVTANSISVTWGKVANATGYDVLLYDSNGKLVSTTKASTNSCTITKNVAANTTYAVKARAKADGFTPSDPSPALKVTTVKAQLKAPGNLAKTGVTANSISVKWGKVANATKYAVSLYNSNGKLVSTTESSTNSCTITKNVAANTTYVVKAKAKADGFTPSKDSSALIVTTAKAQLKAPGNLAKTGVTANSISVKWGKVANAKEYVVFLYDSKGNQVSTTNASTNSCVITKNVAANTKYEIKVRAKADGFTASPLSSALIVKTPRKLNAPKVAEPTSTAKTITVKWDAVANATGYTVAYAPKGSAETDFKKIKIDDKTISCKITGLDAGKTYTVKVRALGDGGENYVASDFAVKNNVKTKATVTLANPGNLVKTATTKTTISVKWNPVKNASGYVVRYAPKGSADSAFKKIETTDLQCTIKGLTAGTSYTVKVRAKGNGDQFTESSFTVKNFGTQLAEPQNVVTTAYPKKLEIKWDSVKNASGYVVRYAPYGSADSAFKKIETTGAHCTITGLKPGTKYTVKVRAKDGDTFAASDFTVKNPTTKKANASSAILDNAFSDFFREGIFEGDFEDVFENV